MYRKFILPLSAVAVGITLAACGQAPANNSPQVTVTETVTVPATPPVAKPSATPRITAPSPNSMIPKTQKTPSAVSTNQSISVFYIAEGDNGKAGPIIGCGDSVVQVQKSSIGNLDRVEKSFNVLLNDHNQQIGQSGLYNALYQSRLSLKTWASSGDTVTVKLTGKLVSGGACDNPRIIAQLVNTVKSATGASEVAILVNDKPLENLLSGK